MVVLLLLSVLLLLRVLLLLILLLLRVLLLLTVLLVVRGLALRCLRLAAVAHLLVVGLVLGQDLPSELLFALVDIRVELVSVLANRKLLIIVDRDVDLLRAHRLLVGVVELGHIRVFQSLLCRQAFVRVEVQQVLEQIQGFRRGRWKHIFEFAGLGGWQRLKHSLGHWTIDAFDVLWSGSAGNLHDSVELVQGGSAWENWFAQQEFGQDAAHAPHVGSLGVSV